MRPLAASWWLLASPRLAPLAMTLSRGQNAPARATPLVSDTAPSWSALSELALATSTGASIAAERKAREAGAGPTHTDAELRLFGKSESDVRVVLYRDTAAWCPYCQKVWLLLELKQIPYRIKKINMRSYGDKPSWFLQKILDDEFSKCGPQMVPPAGTEERRRAQSLLQLERELFSWWCTLTFQPGKGVFDAHERQFLSCLERVDAELGATPGPWFLGGDAPSLVDLQYISHVERMLASVAYWKGIAIRKEGKFRNLETWLQAFERIPEYIATKSDYYTHVMDIPPQYGPGYSVREAANMAAKIGGKGDSWKLPLSLSDETLEPIAPLQDIGADAAQHEAAFKLVSNHVAVARFAARGVGEEGSPKFQAPLADPYAKPNEAYIAPVDTCLRHVASSLLNGVEQATPAAMTDAKTASAEDAKALVICLEYLRDRVGCPRDMGQAAAMYFRAHLNWMIDILSKQN